MDRIVHPFGGIVAAWGGDCTGLLNLSVAKTTPKSHL